MVNEIFRNGVKGVHPLGCLPFGGERGSPSDIPKKTGTSWENDNFSKRNFFVVPRFVSEGSLVPEIHKRRPLNGGLFLTLF
jgi:hypothetical protein